MNFPRPARRKRCLVPVPLDTLRERLFDIATRPRPLFRAPEILLPPKGGRIAESALFRRADSRHVLELGSGWGEFCVSWVSEHPGDDYTAFEVKGDRVARLLRDLRRKAPEAHVRIVPVNFEWFLEDILPSDSFDLIVINCPDPWPKRRHWKHRLVQPGFPARVRPLLRPKGEIVLSTDYGPYARRMLSAFRKSPMYEPVHPWPHYVRERPSYLPGTRFESMHNAQGLRLYYMSWRVR